MLQSSVSKIKCGMQELSTNLATIQFNIHSLSKMWEINTLKYMILGPGVLV